MPPSTRVGRALGAAVSTVLTGAGGRGRSPWPVAGVVGVALGRGVPRTLASTAFSMALLSIAEAGGAVSEGALVALRVGAATVALALPGAAPPLEAFVPLPFRPMPMPTATAASATAASAMRRAEGRRPCWWALASEMATLPPASLRESAPRSPAPSMVDARTKEGRACASWSTEIGPPGGMLGCGVDEEAAVAFRMKREPELVPLGPESLMPE